MGENLSIVKIPLSLCNEWERLSMVPTTKGSVEIRLHIWYSWKISKNIKIWYSCNEFGCCYCCLINVESSTCVFVSFVFLWLSCSRPSLSKNIKRKQGFFVGRGETCWLSVVMIRLLRRHYYIFVCLFESVFYCMLCLPPCNDHHHPSMYPVSRIYICMHITFIFFLHHLFFLFCSIAYLLFVCFFYACCWCCPSNRIYT